MPGTAKKHFDEDLSRANALLSQAHGMPHTTPQEKLLREDLLRSSLMYGVGAVDAYFCDAYADLVARILRAKTLQGNVSIPRGVQNIVLPVSALFSSQTQRDNWKWRMAARGIVEKDNVLSLSKIQKLLNPFFRTGNKLFDPVVIDSLVVSHNAPNRVTGITRSEYRRRTDQPLDSARKSIRKKINERYSKIFQRRHDCIHNCDRPKQSIQTISYARAEKVIKDLNLLVSVIDQHIESEFNEFLTHVGCNAVTRNSAGY
ncbi:hypothetical protein [Marinospirillum perlucidum]|uniref:hypothetical protein n=1 Tax=Marinospirillum perlucidum TaxID=1982602 RepID=UPI00139040A8|nr:hypothetical protein [Marinospirillum perlucidum]